LRSAGARGGLTVGVAVTAEALTRDSNYRDLVAREAASVTPENEMKWRVLRSAPDGFDFSAADAIVDFAVSHGMAVRGHALLWHRDVPAWLDRPGRTPDEVAQILHDHVTTVVARYRGRVTQWDVVNEAIDRDDSSPRDDFWRRALGDEAMVSAFTAARAADPDARLFYNDYGIERRGARLDAVRRLLDTLRAQGAPVDGVGIQCHLRPATAPSPRELERALKSFAKDGLEIAVTELDVALTLPADGDALGAQAQVYAAVARACTKEHACRTLTLWGVTDRHSWVPEGRPGLGAALPFDDAGTPKPAHAALLAALSGTR
jgi:endo-1,4-beta-xylanase